MGITQEIDVSKKPGEGKTEAEILASNVKPGQWWPATDTKRWIYPNPTEDGGGFWSSMGEVWNATDLRWEQKLGNLLGFETSTGLSSADERLVDGAGVTTGTDGEYTVVGVGTGTKRIISAGMAKLSVRNRTASTAIAAGTPVYRDDTSLGLGAVTTNTPGKIDPQDGEPAVGMIYADVTIPTAGSGSVWVLMDIARPTVIEQQVQDNTDAIAALGGATMKIAETGGAFSTSETNFDFDIVTPSDNTDLLDADVAVTPKVVILKKLLRYEFNTILEVNTSGAGDKVITLRVYNAADDTLLNERGVNIDGGNNRPQTKPLSTLYLDNPVEGLELYFTAQCTDTEVDLVELSTTVSTGGGGGGSGLLWEKINDEIVNVGQLPVAINVETTDPTALVITGTGTVNDSTYTPTGNTDGGGNPTLSDGTRTVILDDSFSYWTIFDGITTTNPPFTLTEYCNFTGALTGTYTVILGGGAPGNGTLSGTGGGGPALTANSDIVAPAFEVTGKAARRWNFEGDYLSDNLLEPDTGAAYVIVTNGVDRWALPVQGAGLGTQFYRSGFFGGVSGPTDPNADVDVANTDFDASFLPCQTDVNGADLGVGHNLQVLGAVMVGDALTGADRALLLPDRLEVYDDATGNFTLVSQSRFTSRNLGATWQATLDYSTGLRLVDTVTARSVTLDLAGMAVINAADYKIENTGTGDIEARDLVLGGSIAERELLGPKGAVAREDLTDMQSIACTAGTGVTISAERSRANASMVDLSASVSVTTARASGDTIMTAPAPYRPSITKYNINITDPATGEVTGGAVTDAGVLLTYGPLAVATYRVGASYARQ